MNNIEALLKIIEQYEAKFVSLKYLDNNDELRQIDIAVNGLVVIEDFVLVCNIKLRPIENRYFLDPFRSLPTIFCLCDKLNDQHYARHFLKTIILQATPPNNIKFELAINFLILNKSENLVVIKDNNKIECYPNQVEPYDQLANLRAEIIDILETIGISTVSHYHASNLSSCAIVIKADDFLEIADCFVIACFIIRNVAESYGKTAFFFKELKNDLYLLLPAAEYDKKLAISIILNIMCNLKNNPNEYYWGHEYFGNQLPENSKDEQDIWQPYYCYEESRNFHRVNFSLYQTVPLYMAIAYLITHGLGDIIKGGAEIRQKYQWRW